MIREPVHRNHPNGRSRIFGKCCAPILGAAAHQALDGKPCAGIGPTGYESSRCKQRGMIYRFIENSRGALFAENQGLDRLEGRSAQRPRRVKSLDDLLK